MATSNRTDNVVTTRAKNNIKFAVQYLTRAMSENSPENFADAIDSAGHFLSEARSEMERVSGKYAANMRRIITTLERSLNTLWNSRTVNVVTTRAKNNVKFAVQYLTRAMSENSPENFAEAIENAEHFLSEARSEMDRVSGKYAANMRRVITTLERSLNTLWNSRMVNSTANAVVYPVKSSVLTRIAYEHADNTLTVEFKGGRQYAYYDVPRRVWDAFRKAPSVGVFYNDEIKGQYNSYLVHTPMKSETGSSKNARTQNDEERTVDEMRFGDRYAPPITDGLDISRNSKKYYVIRNYRKVQNSDQSIEVIIDTEGSKVIDGKDLACVIAQVVAQSTGPAAAIKATDIKPLDAASPITQIVDFPEPNVQIVPGPDIFVEAYKAPESNVADVVGGAHASTTPESTDPVQANDVFIATNRRTNNMEIVPDLLEAYHAQNVVDSQRQLHNMLLFSNLTKDPFLMERITDTVPQ